MNNYRGAADWSQATVENPGSDPSDRWSAAANRDGNSHQLTLTGACPMQFAKALLLSHGLLPAGTNCSATLKLSFQKVDVVASRAGTRFPPSLLHPEALGGRIFPIEMDSQKSQGCSFLRSHPKLHSSHWAVVPLQKVRVVGIAIGDHLLVVTTHTEDLWQKRRTARQLM
jgi:hypothetical protein